MRDNQVKILKIPRAYRLDPVIVQKIQQKAKEQNQTETWIVEMILAVAFELREPPKPFELKGLKIVA